MIINKIHFLFVCRSLIGSPLMFIQYQVRLLGLELQRFSFWIEELQNIFALF